MRCRSCPAICEMYPHVRTGNRMILERDNDTGNIVIDGTNRAHVFKDHAAALTAIDEHEDLLDQSGVTYISHHAVCPAAQEWRERKAAERAAAATAQPDLFSEGSKERAQEFARDVAARGYPCQEVIDIAGAELVDGQTPETWRIGDYHVVLTAEGVRLREATPA